MSAYAALLPGGLLAGGMLAVLGVDLVGRGRRPSVAVGVALVALLAAAAAALLGPRSGVDTVLGVLRPDAFGVTITVFCCLTGVVTLLATMRGEALRHPGGEFLLLVLAAVLGMSILAESVDIVSLYLAFETVSIPSYVLVGMRRADRAAGEASLKYVLFGAVSSGLMLYGLSWIVGLSGGTSLDAVSAAVAAGAGAQPAFVVAVVLVLAGFAFKISAVPFHFWAPDVYAGAPASVAGFLAVASKAAGFAALVRVMGAVAGTVPDALHPLTTLFYDGNAFTLGVSILAVLSMTVGNLAALRQGEVKRLLAWSSIAHAGYLLLALAVWSEGAAAALVVYLIAYLFMNLAAFFLAGVVIRERGSGDLAGFQGLGRESPLLAISFAVVLFSLTGLPPFFGFVGKLTVFYAVFAKGYLWLGVIGLLNGVLSLTYYAKIVARMYLADETAPAPKRRFSFGAADALLCLVLTLPLLLLFVWWSGVWELARSAVSTLFGGA